MKPMLRIGSKVSETISQVYLKNLKKNTFCCEIYLLLTTVMQLKSKLKKLTLAQVV